jgi:hypothetical protein
MSQANIKKLESNQLCIVIAKDPARIKFVDPIPAQSSRTEIENAAIKLSRMLLNNRQWASPGGTWDIGTITEAFVQFLVEGTPLDAAGTKEERESKIYNDERQEELRRMAREDARAERLKLKKTLEEKSKVESKPA